MNKRRRSQLTLPGDTSFLKVFCCVCLFLHELVGKVLVAVRKQSTNSLPPRRHLLARQGVVR